LFKALAAFGVPHPEAAPLLMLVSSLMVTTLANAQPRN